MDTKLGQFQDQQYLILETYRRSGVGVKTPVWFAQAGEKLYVWTQANSGKAKRIRNNPDVKIAPSKVDGTPVGKWVPAKAVEDGSDAALEHVTKLLKQKYGAAFTVFGLMGKMSGVKHTSIRLQVEG